jgi:hypothetical protein
VSIEAHRNDLLCGLARRPASVLPLPIKKCGDERVV